MKVRWNPGNVPSVYVQLLATRAFAYCIFLPLHPLFCGRFYPRESRPFLSGQGEDSKGRLLEEVPDSPGLWPQLAWVCLGTGVRQSLNVVSQHIPRAAVSAVASFTISFWSSLLKHAYQKRYIAQVYRSHFINWTHPHNQIIHSCYCVMFHFVNAPHLIFLFQCWWTFG